MSTAAATNCAGASLPNAIAFAAMPGYAAHEPEPRVASEKAGSGRSGGSSEFCSPGNTIGAGRNPAPENHQPQTKRASDSVLLSDASLGASGRANHPPGEQSLSKKSAFHARLSALRKTPGHCGRCGKASTEKQCAKCRAYHARHRAAKRVMPVTVDSAHLAAIVRRTASLELAVARLQLAARDAFKRGYRSGQRCERKARFADPEEISAQELATMNHAYAR